MSILDQRQLIESIHPFELLSTSTLDALMQKIDIAYYPKDTLLISQKIPASAFTIIIKGSVNEIIDDEIHYVYTIGDTFDADALIYNTTNSKFIVEEDLICYEIKKEDFLELLENKKVQSYFLQDFVTRHQQLKNHDARSNLTPFLVSRVSDIYLHLACIVEPNETIYNALVKMKEIKGRVILYKKDKEYSIITDTNLRENVLLGDYTINDSVASIASHGIITIDYHDFLFNALLLMTQNAIKRVVVTDGDKIVGILEQLDLLSYFASHSHLVAVRIDKASNIEDLKNLQEDLRNILVTLHSQGVKVRYITKLVATLNAKIYNKLFGMCVPQELQKRCALIVMGSEGREEQSVKTDQDNALVIQNGIDIELFREPMIQLNHYLLELGFPKCEGNVMVSNDFYRRDIKGYKTLIDSWVSTMNEEALQQLSIFMDAKYVAGDPKLVTELTEFLHHRFHARDDVLAHMAKAVLAFETPLSIFSGFLLEKNRNNKLDLKKGGIFAIVHGVRTLALQYEIKETNTIQRIKELNNRGIIDKIFATELIECFDTLSTLRLKAMLEANDFSDANYINPAKLEKIQVDLLKDSFKIVNHFKKFMSFHFHLNMVS
ncbi:MAG: putative nucleotidyltransferase substrate binding domain-containing protein [Sulfurimonadaceae bacterium]|nr:putative nucleotidyltransferase substrate binding domain-containing protein [Sulfurimonadaceae bacterium]